MCKRRGLKVNAGKSKVIVLNGEKGFECEVYIDGIYLERVSEFKYLGYVLNEAGTDRAECSRMVASGRICNLSVIESCMKHWLYLLLCMAMRQCYERSRRDLVLELYR